MFIICKDSTLTVVVVKRMTLGFTVSVYSIYAVTLTLKMYFITYSGDFVIEVGADRQNNCLGLL